MKKIILYLLLLPLFSISQKINFNTKYPNLFIKEKDSTNYSFILQKDNYYTFLVENKGINVKIALLDKDGKQLDNDESYDETDPAKIKFSPDKTDLFTLKIKLKKDKDYPNQGNYSFIVKDVPKELKKISYSNMVQDLEILKSAYAETRVGLWYNNYFQLDSIFNIQKSKLKEQMTALEFFQTIAPIVAFTKEGHSSINLSDGVNDYVKKNYLYLPLLVKIINGKVYALNDIENFKTKGLEISAINGENIQSVLKTFLSIEPSDGFNVTSKYHWIEKKFSAYYTKFYKQAKTFDIEFTSPNTNEKVSYKAIPTIHSKEFISLAAKIIKTIPNYKYKEVSSQVVDEKSSTSILTFNDFGTDAYKGGREGFKQLLEIYFKTIANKQIKNIIIDIRKNEGGTQGMEDHLLSYLIEKPYLKYKYVEIPAYTFSFSQHTQINTKKQALEFENMFRDEFYLTTDGRYLNKADKYKGDFPNENNFKGKIYILINGLTFSGGSEFAALAKNYTNAKFIGEETGGGYYGNTSGEDLKLTLPNSDVMIRIPLCKFVVEPKEFGIPFGRGILPDYSVQPTIDDFLNGYDTEMEFTKKLLREK